MSSSTLTNLKQKRKLYVPKFYKNYGVETDKIVEKSNLIFDKPEYKENTIKSLEKGNIVKVKFEQDDKIVEGKAISILKTET